MENLWALIKGNLPVFVMFYVIMPVPRTRLFS